MKQASELGCIYFQTHLTDAAFFVNLAYQYIVRMRKFNFHDVAAYFIIFKSSVHITNSLTKLKQFLLATENPEIMPGYNH